ncbi:phytanoyl-CoA dioxygenase family protein [Roseobacter sp. EG26]|uniref:phytanoyl-CoA dioxygenase family protein n=1 Tax=Roseobacter sp. EG26 TaxID=3412477 RepID=UPI003CE48DA0
MKLSLTLDQYADQMRDRGWVILEEAVAPALVEKMANDIERAWDVCSAIMEKNGIATDADLTVHHLIGQRDSYLEFIDTMEPLMPYLEHYFEGKFILNSFGGAINTRARTSYAQRVHRDIRSYSGDMPLLLNTLVMLDDFTADNGATHMLSGSHKAEEKPADEVFYASSEQAIAPAGSILIFNSNVWHAGGDNRTDTARRSVTPMYCKPFIKQQFDYPRAMGYDMIDKLKPHTRQILGYNARVPATLEEWYQPPENRMYRGDQG